MNRITFLLLGTLVLGVLIWQIGPGKIVRTTVQLPAPPPAPVRALPLAAGGENWLSLPDEAIVVQEGGTLLTLAHDVYGFTDETILRGILEANPGSTDPNTLLVGTTIRFPAIRAADADKSQPR